MGKGGRKETVKTTATSAPDAASARYIANQRQFAQNAANMAQAGPEGGWFTGAITPEQIQAAMNPYIGSVVDATRGEFDHLRDQAATSADQMATQAGAFGGSRHGIATGTRLGALDRAQAGTIAQLLQGGYGQAQQFAQDQQALEQQKRLSPLFGARQGMDFLNMGMGPVGMNSTSTQMSHVKDPWGQFNSILGTVGGLGLSAAGMGLFGGGRGGG